MIAILSRGPSRALEGLAWLGLACALAFLWSVASRPISGPACYAAIGPQQLTDWVNAVCGAIGALAAALNGAAIVWNRWGRPARKPRRHRDTPPPGPAPHTGTRGGA